MNYKMDAVSQFKRIYRKKKTDPEYYQTFKQLWDNQEQYDEKLKRTKKLYRDYVMVSVHNTIHEEMTPVDVRQGLADIWGDGTAEFEEYYTAFMNNRLVEKIV